MIAIVLGLYLTSVSVLIYFKISLFISPFLIIFQKYTVFLFTKGIMSLVYANQNIWGRIDERS